MVSLAEEAGVSRQLVYQHFESLQQVIGATLQYIFEDVFVRTRDEVAAHGAQDIKGTVASLQSITFDIPVGRARALWQAMSASGWGDAELTDVSRTVRRLLMRTTQPLFQVGMGITAEQAAPLTWMMMISFWGARQLVDDGELSRDDAMRLYSWLVDRILFNEGGLPPELVAAAHGKSAKASAGVATKAPTKKTAAKQRQTTQSGGKMSSATKQRSAPPPRRRRSG